MSEKNKLAEKLLYAPKNGYDRLSAEDEKAMEAYCEDYKKFLNNGKTERLCVEYCIELAEKKGFKAYEAGMKLSAGDKVYFNNRGKGIMLAVIGSEDLSHGANIGAAHTDSPRLDLKPRPLYEEAEMAYFKTHHYGGIRKYQWVTIPLELHGVVVLHDGSKVDVHIGGKEDDPQFIINDLLPHLGREQGKKPLNEAIPSESLNVLLGGKPFEDKDCSDRFKLGVLQYLNAQYGITEEDFISAELCAVPAFAEATPGEAANTAATKITAENASTEKGAGFAKSIADYYTANPTVPVTKQNANAAATVINAHADKAIANGTFDKDTIKKVYPSAGSVTNAVAVQTIEKSQISNLSLTKKDDNTLVLSATWTGTQPSAGANIAVYGMDTSAAYQIVFVDDAGNRTTIDSVSKVADGVVVFWVPHFSTYEIVKVSAAADTAPAAAASATTTVDAAAVDAQFYTCKACGYHNWTGTVGGYKCDHCGHIEAKDLSSYPNVKGTATLPTATSAAASNNIIKATGADMSMVVLAVLALAAALVAGFACIVRKQGLGK